MPIPLTDDVPRAAGGSTPLPARAQAYRSSQVPLLGFAKIRGFMSTVIRTFHNANKEEVGRLTFDEKDKRLHIQSSAPPGIDRRFRTEKGAANWWESNVDPETGKIRRQPEMPAGSPPRT